MKGSFASSLAVVPRSSQKRERAILLSLLLVCAPGLWLRADPATARGLLSATAPAPDAAAAPSAQPSNSSRSNEPANPTKAAPAHFLLAATAVVDDDPLPAKSPEAFNPDPGGRSGPLTNRAPVDAPPVTPDLFAQPIPLPAPIPTNNVHERVPFKLRLPREGVKLTDEPELVSRENLPYPQYVLSEGGIGVLPNAIPQTNRWRIPFGDYQRYADRRMAETPYQDGPLRLFDPYKVSLLKGDSPIIGQDIFLSLTGENQFEADFRRIPVGSNVSAARPSSYEFFGRSESYTLSNTSSVIIELFKGETAFKPVEWAVHITPVFNINFSEFKETGIVDPDPRGPNFDGTNPQPRPPLTIVNPGDIDTTIGGDLHKTDTDHGRTRYTQRTRETFTLQEWYVEYHIRDLSSNYDFISSRVGSQLFVSDFRGFIFNDTDPGVRIFGNYDDNRIQYNAAYFSVREKDTFSGLQQFSNRNQDVFVLNFFRQDFLQLFLPATDALAQGYTAQLSFHANLDHGEKHYDKNGFLVRPAPIGGPIDEHDINAFYLGWAGDGHIGWVNITHAFYEVLGHDDLNGIAGHGVDLNAQMFALELSYDRDYIRPKFSFFYASGDGDVKDHWGNGFDGIYDNPTFAGAPFSFFTRQGFGLANAAVLAKAPNSLLLDLRTSKTEGQANFVNPGTLLIGGGVDIEISPKLRAQFNANYIRFVDTDSVRESLFTNQVDNELGWDISLGFTYKPLLTRNIIINAGFGAFIPGRGYRDIYRELTNPVPGFTTDPKGEIDSFLYSGLVAVTLTF